MASRSHYIALARQLPPPLLRFLSRYPHASILPKEAAADPEAHKTGYQRDVESPFRFWKHPVTGRWQNPIYSYRRQADLSRTARAYGVEELLPETPKGTEERVIKRVEHGLRVKGTGVGQKVKGKKHERMVGRRMRLKRMAMLRMPWMIAQWRKLGKKKWRTFPTKAWGK